jgi:hypothetical protein
MLFLGGFAELLIKCQLRRQCPRLAARGAVVEDHPVSLLISAMFSRGYAVRQPDITGLDDPDQRGAGGILTKF